MCEIQQTAGYQHGSQQGARNYDFLFHGPLLFGELNFQQPLTIPPAPRQGNRFVVVDGAVGDETVGGEVMVGNVGNGIMAPTVGDTVIVGTAAAEVTPRFPISVDPNGIPVLATPPGITGEVDVGVDIGVEDDAMLPEPEPHIPDIPEVSSVPDDIEIPAGTAGGTVPTDTPPPSKLELDPNIEGGALPKVEHVMPFGVATVPVASAGAGLMPGDTISVEPRGMPVGPTVEAGPI
jgi:hypothetical protein